MDTLALLWEFMAEGIVLSLLTAMVLPLLGGLLFLRRSALLGVAVPQFSAAGIAGGLALLPWFPSLHQEYLDHGHPPLGYLFFFAAGAAGACLLLFAVMEKHGRRGSTDARVAVAFSLAAAASLLFLSMSPVGGSLVQTLQRGSVVVADWHALVTVALVDLSIALLLWRFLRGLVLVSYDRDEAFALGHRPQNYDRLFHVMVGAGVGAGVMTVGPVFVFGLLFLPPVAAHGVSSSLRAFFLHCLVVGLVPALIAWPVSFHLDLPFGPVAVALAGLLVLLYALVGRALQKR